MSLLVSCMVWINVSCFSAQQNVYRCGFGKILTWFCDSSCAIFAWVCLLTLNFLLSVILQLHKIPTFLRAPEERYLLSRLKVSILHLTNFLPESFLHRIVFDMQMEQSSFSFVLILLITSINFDIYVDLVFGIFGNI